MTETLSGVTACGIILVCMLSITSMIVLFRRYRVLQDDLKHARNDTERARTVTGAVSKRLTDAGDMGRLKDKEIAGLKTDRVSLEKQVKCLIEEKVGLETQISDVQVSLKRGHTASGNLARELKHTQERLTLSDKKLVERERQLSESQDNVRNERTITMELKNEIISLRDLLEKNPGDTDGDTAEVELTPLFNVTARFIPRKYNLVALALYNENGKRILETPERSLYSAQKLAEEELGDLNQTVFILKRE